MTQATDLAYTARRAGECRLIAGVSAAAFRQPLLHPACCAPLFAFVRADYGVSYTEIGLALTIFNVGVGRPADASRLPGRSRQRAARAGRRAIARRTRPRRGLGGEFLLGTGRACSA